jgi:hypothetical protein
METATAVEQQQEKTLEQQREKARRALARMEEAVAKLTARLEKEEADWKFLTNQRAAVLESLSRLSWEDREKQNRVLDGFDSRLRSAERLLESIKLERASFVAEMEKLRLQLAEIEDGIKAEEHRKALEAFRIQLEQAVRRASEDLDAARVSLAKLAILGRKVDELDKEGLRIVEQMLVPFIHQHGAIGSRGFGEVLGVRSAEMRFLIYPAARPQDLN